jgi:hypothetical protein
MISIASTTLAIPGHLSGGQMLRAFWLPAMGGLAVLTGKLVVLWWVRTVRRGRDPLEALADRSRQFIVLPVAATVVVVAELITYAGLVAVVGWLWPSLTAAAVAVAEWVAFFTLAARLRETDERERQEPTA